MPIKNAFLPILKEEAQNYLSCRLRHIIPLCVCLMKRPSDCEPLLLILSSLATAISVHYDSFYYCCFFLFYYYIHFCIVLTLCWCYYSYRLFIIIIALLLMNQWILTWLHLGSVSRRQHVYVSPSQTYRQRRYLVLWCKHVYNLATIFKLYQGVAHGCLVLTRLSIANGGKA